MFFWGIFNFFFILVMQMKQSVEGKRLFENTFSLPLQENKSFDEKKIFFGNSERREIKLPESSRINFNEKKSEGQKVQVVSSIKNKSKEDDNCSLI